MSLPELDGADSCCSLLSCPGSIVETICTHLSLPDLVRLGACSTAMHAVLEAQGVWQQAWSFVTSSHGPCKHLPASAANQLGAASGKFPKRSVLSQYLGLTAFLSQHVLRPHPHRATPGLTAHNTLQRQPSTKQSSGLMQVQRPRDLHLLLQGWKSCPYGGLEVAGRTCLHNPHQPSGRCSHLITIALKGKIISELHCDLAIHMQQHQRQLGYAGSHAAQWLHTRKPLIPMRGGRTYQDQRSEGSHAVRSPQHSLNGAGVVILPTGNSSCVPACASFQVCVNQDMTHELVEALERVSTVQAAAAEDGAAAWWAADGLVQLQRAMVSVDQHGTVIDNKTSEGPVLPATWHVLERMLSVVLARNRLRSSLLGRVAVVSMHQLQAAGVHASLSSMAAAGLPVIDVAGVLQPGQPATATSCPVPSTSTPSVPSTSTPSDPTHVSDHGSVASQKSSAGSAQGGGGNAPGMCNCPCCACAHVTGSMHSQVTAGGAASPASAASALRRAVECLSSVPITNGEQLAAPVTHGSAQTAQTRSCLSSGGASSSAEESLVAVAAQSVRVLLLPVITPNGRRHVRKVPSRPGSSSGSTGCKTLAPALLGLMVPVLSALRDALTRGALCMHLLNGSQECHTSGSGSSSWGGCGGLSCPCDEASSGRLGHLHAVLLVCQDASMVDAVKRIADSSLDRL